MDLEASLKLLDLSSDATIDDANQAYADLHRMIDRFHRQPDKDLRGDRKEDMQLLACAYEKAVACLSDPTRSQGVDVSMDAPSVVPRPRSTDLHFTINFPSDGDAPADAEVATTPADPDVDTVEEADSITSRRLVEAQSRLPVAQQAVNEATTRATMAKGRHERARQASIHAAVAATSARTRAALLEIEAKRVMDDAIAQAKNARNRFGQARQAARQARVAGRKAQEQVGRVRTMEEAAAVEAAAAEKALRKSKADLQALTHTVITTRRRLKQLRDSVADTGGAAPEDGALESDAVEADRDCRCDLPDGETDERRQLLQDLLEIEAFLKQRKRHSAALPDRGSDPTDSGCPTIERRQHDRLTYPNAMRPCLAIGARRIAILDLSAAGMRLAVDPTAVPSRIVRGVIEFIGHPPVKVTGKVVRQDPRGLGLRLATRIGSRIIDRERRGLIG